MGRRLESPSPALIAVLLALVAVATGCTYAKARGKDALDMFDVGFTVSTKPQFGIYGNCPFIAPGGYSKVDGHYIGLGGGKFGVMEHHQDAAGLLMWGRENITWKDAKTEETSGTGKMQVGPLGMAADEEGNPVYKPQCAHYLHLGFIGLTGNLNYKEWPDFFAGFAGFDPNEDDWRATARPAKEQRLVDLSARIARPRDGLQLLMRTDKEVYGPDEPIAVDVQLVNRTGQQRFHRDRPRDLSIYFEPVAETPGGGEAEWQFNFHIFEIYSGKARYHSPKFEVPEEARQRYYHHVTLPPGAFVGRRFIFPPPRQQGWLEPGDHFIVASYQVSDEYPYVIISPRLTAHHAKALGTEKAYTRVWTGRIFSNIVTFRVSRGGGLGLF